jgi:uncharacterized protein
MKVEVKVKANARRNVVEVLANGTLKVSVAAPALEGKANEHMIDLLASHYGVPKSHIEILRGARSSRKLIQILTA